jgi:RNA polymerase sigma factor (sigma-70 family)
VAWLQIHASIQRLPTVPDTALPIQDWSDRSRELGALLSRVALGDRAAFEQLYKRTGGHLFAVVLRIQRDRGQAEDLLQEIYVAVWKSAGGFDAARSQPLTWLTHIARNRAIDSLRRAQTQPQTESLTRDDDDDGREDDRLPDDSPGPLQLLGAASERRELQRCMEQLSPNQRQSVALAFFDGLSHAEVAEHLREPLGTVKSWVRRALNTLKSCLDRAVTREGVARGPSEGAAR